MDVAGGPDLMAAMAEALVRGDISGYFEAEVELEGLYLTDAWARFGKAQYEEAEQHFQTVAGLNADLIRVLEKGLGQEAQATADDRNQLTEWLQAAEWMMHMATGYVAVA